MADYVAERRSGMVVETVDGASLLKAIRGLRDSYTPIATSVYGGVGADFSLSRLQEDYRTVYDAVIEGLVE